MCSGTSSEGSATSCSGNSGKSLRRVIVIRAYARAGPGDESEGRSWPALDRPLEAHEAVVPRRLGVAHPRGGGAQGVGPQGVADLATGAGRTLDEPRLAECREVLG